MPEHIAINPTFFTKIQTKTGLSDKALLRALNLTAARLQELKTGATPTLAELAEIQLGFNLNEGIPMTVAIADDKGGADKEAINE